MNIADLRKEYTRRGLDEAGAAADPFEQFQIWFDQALGAGVPEPNAMTLATVGAGGRPSARVVLLKGFDRRGLAFYTNYSSRKASELNATGQTALVFFWPELERQIRVEGRAEQVAAAESDAYFASRPAGSRLGAWASPQSQVIDGRSTLERRLAEAVERWGDDAPRPPHWGGYRVVPDMFEFWQGRPSRLHDRLRYRLDGDSWIRERLAP